ncbi:MAG TPA: hypothetical protein VGM05_26960 [Planctomycetaceae bacterium]|jgi:hypothetical protein
MATLQEIQEAENQRARDRQKGAEARELEVNERRARTARLEGAWPYVPAPHPLINDGAFPWTGWRDAILAFCGAVSAEGQQAEFILNIRGMLDLPSFGFSPANIDMLSLILDGLTGGIAGIDSRLATLADAGRKGWGSDFGNGGWVDLIQYPDLENRRWWADAEAAAKKEEAEFESRKMLERESAERIESAVQIMTQPADAINDGEFRAEKTDAIEKQHPSNVDVRELCAKLYENERLPVDQKRSKNEVAREYTREIPRDDSKAQNLLRQCRDRRYRWLWELESAE